MTEKQWLTGADPHPLIERLGKEASTRKLRLLACGCCRRLWEHLSPRARHSLEVAEKFADRQASAIGPCYSAISADNCASFAARPNQGFRRLHLKHSLLHGAWAANWPGGRVTIINPKWEAAEKAAQADLVRDVFGNPFRPAKFSKHWRTWKDSIIFRLAQAVYEDRNFKNLPILGDALEEAGCTDTAILAHCRGAKPHCRGCFVVDALLGKS